MTEIKKVNSNSKQTLDKCVFSENAELNLEAGTEVISVNAESNIASCEALDKELRVGVCTVFRVIYKDAEGKLDVKEVRTDAMKIIQNPDINPTTEAVLDATAKNSQYLATATGKATANVEISGWFVKENVLSFMSSDVENVYCRTETFSVENPVLLKGGSLTVTNSDEARMPVKKVLESRAAAVINNVYPSDGTYRIEGELTLRIAAVADNDQFINQSFTHPFGTEISDESVKSDSVLDAEAKAVSCEVTVTENDARIFISDVKINFRVCSVQKSEIEGVTDCYSVTNEIAVTSENAKMDSYFCYRTVRDKSSCSVIPGGMINELCCVLNPTVTEVTVASEEKGLTVQGVISADLLYIDENNVCKSFKAEIPFATDFAKDYPCDGYDEPSVTVTNLSCRLRTGSEIEITAEFALTLRGVSEKTVTMISTVETGAEKEADDYAISLYIVRPGETLWDVAKALNTDEDTLLKLNEDLKIPLTGGEKILVYKELTFPV